MSNRFQPGEEMFDEVEGHKLPSPEIVADERSEVEGHGFIGRPSEAERRD